MPSALDLAAVLGSDFAHAAPEEGGARRATRTTTASSRSSRRRSLHGPRADWGSTVYDAWLYALQPMFVPHGNAVPRLHAHAALGGEGPAVRPRLLRRAQARHRPLHEAVRRGGRRRAIPARRELGRARSGRVRTPRGGGRAAAPGPERAQAAHAACSRRCSATRSGCSRSSSGSPGTSSRRSRSRRPTTTGSRTSAASSSRCWFRTSDAAHGQSPRGRPGRRHRRRPRQQPAGRARGRDRADRPHLRARARRQGHVRGRASAASTRTTSSRTRPVSAWTTPPGARSSTRARSLRAPPGRAPFLAGKEEPPPATGP